ncbi:MAG: hypothetical protein HC794_10640 [Nitrospiraceae bacterium]|nr:hypothetical protein [Nitrospiraceae bacterium]
MRPVCIIAGGEPTVTMTGRGKGGRAQEFAAAGAFDLDGIPNAWLAAIGTDGTDGPTEMAGASSPAQPWHKLNNVASTFARHSGGMTPTQPSRSWDATSTPGRQAPTSTTFTSSSSCRYYPPR